MRIPDLSPVAVVELTLFYLLALAAVLAIAQLR